MHDNNFLKSRKFWIQKHMWPPELVEGFHPPPGSGENEGWAGRLVVGLSVEYSGGEAGRKGYSSLYQGTCRAQIEAVSLFSCF